MAHAPALGRGTARDKAENGLGHSLLKKSGRFFLGGAADLPDHDHRVGAAVGFKLLKNINKITSWNGIAADADHGGLAQALTGQLINRLISQRAGTRDHADG